MKKIIAVGGEQWLDELTARLEGSQADYLLAKTPKELAFKLKTETPDIVLCDLKMPRLSGSDVLRQIKAANIDIVLMVRDPGSFDFAMLTHVFEAKVYAHGHKSKEVRAPSLSFSTAPELHNPRSGRLDARRVADFFGMAPAKLAKVLGRSPQSLHKTPDAESLQKPLTVFARIATSLLSAFDSKEQARIWLYSPNPDLDDTRPIELVEKKKPDLVAELLEDALLGHPG